MFKISLLGLLAACSLLAADSDKIAQGKYLVDEVAKCGDCHTPMTEDGKVDTSRWMKGSTLPFAPIGNIPDWHKTAPDLTSSGRLFTRWKEEGLVKFLTTGVGPNGHAADPPMPAYKLKQDDAEAIVAYLKTLK